MSQILSKSYSLSALLIHASKQQVTADKIKAVFEALNLSYSPKIASMFELNSDRYDNMLTNTGAAAAPAPAAGAAAAAAPVEEAEPEEESDNVLDF
ncbi:large subunit ribosomal protein LP1 [Pancytospora philotis]|nr:large subunit ribosomal protein LP1 [Pancytospora philotis]